MKITLIAALLAQLAFTASASPLPNAEPVADAAAAADYGKPPRPVDYCLLACYPRDDPNFKCPKGFVRTTPHFIYTPAPLGHQPFL
jgi:hypothetical protein